MKPASILSHAEGNRLHKLATALADLTSGLLNGKPKRRRRRRKAKAAKVKAPKAPKAKKSAKAKKYPVETPND